MMNYLRKDALLLLAVLFIATPTYSQPAQSAQTEINEGARLYRAGKFDEARQHFENALKLDPTNKNAPSFIARAIHAQYKPGVDSAENITLAREAIAAYQRVFEADPNNDDAYNAVASLYGAINDDEQQRAWIEQRANRADVPVEKRSEAYTVLASKQWDCSFKVTEKSENRQTEEIDGKVVTRFVKPKDAAELTTAQQCVERGMELVEKAIELNADSGSAWSYKANLLKEKVKLAEMQGQTQEKEMLAQQAEEAQKRALELSSQQRGKQ